MTSNVLMCIGIFCFFLLVYACVLDDPIFCAGSTPEKLEAMKIKTNAQTQNLKTAMTVWVGFVTAFSSIVIKAKMKPVVKGGFWSAGMGTGSGFTYGMYKTANADLLSNMNSSTFHSPASSASASPVTTTPASTATTTPATTTPASTTTPAITTPASTATTATTTEASPATTTPLSSNGDSTQSLDQQPYNIHSPVEEEKSSLIWDLFIKILPEWIKEDIASRLPSCSNTGTYHILFMQYNLFVYLMCAAFIFFWFFVALIYILTWIKNNREYFIEKVLPTFLSKLVPSKSVLGAMITVNKASLMLYVMAPSAGLHFVFFMPSSGSWYGL